MGRHAVRSKEIEDFIIHHIEKHPTDIARVTAEKFGLSRVAVVNRLRGLAKEGLLGGSGKTKARKYELQQLASVQKTIEVNENSKEHEVWLTLVKPQLTGIPENVLGICAHGFTEMFNNVIDHSESTTAQIIVRRDAASVLMSVRDWGVGIFNKVQKALNLTDPQHSILELAKGKVTTDKDKHTGEGIFFTSRMFDNFIINSGELSFTRARQSDDWLFESDSAPIQGTQVIMRISTNATHTAKEIFDTYRAQYDTFGFSRTNIPLVLLKYEGEQLISRSQAKRLMARVEKFKEVVLDFKGITSIGQAFADEVFRVYRKEHPEVHVYPIHIASDDVVNMVKRIVAEDPNDPLNTFLDITNKTTDQ
jgi:anti-sigma regulatory factor (Ser/Thr protein kinase)